VEKDHNQKVFQRFTEEYFRRGWPGGKG